MRDPVCGMDVNVDIAEREQLYEDYDGKRYFFCTPACRQVFFMDTSGMLSVAGRSIDSVP